MLVLEDVPHEFDYLPVIPILTISGCDEATGVDENPYLLIPTAILVLVNIFG